MLETMIKVRFLKSVYPFKKGQEGEINERAYKIHRKNVEVIENIEDDEEAKKAAKKASEEAKKAAKNVSNKAILKPKANK